MLCAYILLTSAWVVGGIAQQSTPPPKPEAAKPKESAPSPPEQKEFQAATGEKDPRKKAELLEKFIQAHPRDPRISMARRETLRARYKLSRRKAGNWLKSYGATIEPAQAAPLQVDYAEMLLRDRKSLRTAERYALQAAQGYTWEGVQAAAKMEPEQTREARTDASLRREFESTSDGIQNTLGRVYAARGDTRKAEPILLEVVKKDASAADAAQALADLAEKRKDAQDSLSWRAHAALAKPNQERRNKFTAAYLRVKGSNTGIEDYLDSEYRRLFPRPAHVAAYQKTGKKTNRVVLAEVYTGSGCAPCAGADVAFDSIMERYRPQDVVVVMYHEHIPRPDPLANSDTVARWKWQEGRGVPTYGVDGEMLKGGGGPRLYAPEIEKIVREAADQRLEVAPGAALELSATNDGQVVRVLAKVRGVESEDASVRVLLVEKEVRYSGENGIRFHPMVVRRIAGFDLKNRFPAEISVDFPASVVDAALKQHIDDFEKHDDRHNKDGEFRFVERRDKVDWKKVAVVAFVQDTKTKKVLQAAWADAPVAQSGVPTGE